MRGSLLFHQFRVSEVAPWLPPAEKFCNFGLLDGWKMHFRRMNSKPVSKKSSLFFFRRAAIFSKWYLRCVTQPRSQLLCNLDTVERTLIEVALSYDHESNSRKVEKWHRIASPDSLPMLMYYTLLVSNININ